MNKRRGEKIINHHIAEGTRESHPRVHDFQHLRLGKPRRGLQIMDIRIGLHLSFRNMVINSITLRQTLNWNAGTCVFSKQTVQQFKVCPKSRSGLRGCKRSFERLWLVGWKWKLKALSFSDHILYAHLFLNHELVEFHRKNHQDPC